MENFAKSVTVQDVTNSCIVRVESCELYLSALANLIDTQITQIHFQQSFDDKENDQGIIRNLNTTRNNQKLIGSQNIFRRAYDSLPRLENHIRSIIDGQHLTEKCKTILVKIKLDLWYGIKL